VEPSERAGSDRTGLNVPMMLVLGAVGAGVGVGLSFLMRYLGAG
jgi:hypothetical protein